MPNNLKKAFAAGAGLLLSVAVSSAQNTPMSFHKDSASRLRPVLSGLNSQRSTSEVITDASNGIRRQVPEDGRDYKVVIEEDFSLCTAGSEENPVKEFIEDANFNIPAKYTHTPGWSGRSIMQAGGAICIGKYYDSFTDQTMTGQIETPVLDLHRDRGRAYLQFRAKSLKPDVDLLTIRWVTPGDPLPTTGEEQTVYVNGTIWTTVNVDLTDCPEDAIVQIWSEYNELLIDDIKIEQYQPVIDEPKALKWTDFTGDSFTANWSEVEGADHYLLNCYYVRREGSEDQLPDYKYILKDKEVKETSYNITGLDPEKVYYYYVYAVNADGVVSSESQVVEVLALTVPTDITISNVKPESFRVDWSPVLNAEGYGFQALLTHTAHYPQNYALIDELFDCIVTEGTIGKPFGNAIGYYDMDSYGLSRANWVLYEGGLINGGIALHNYVSTYGTQYYGELVSPILTIGESTGEITIEGEFCTLDEGVRPYIQIAVPGEVDGKTQWVLGAGGEVDAEIGSEWTYVKKTYKVNPGLVRFSIGTTDGGWLYMDNLSISVNLPEGAKQTLPYHYNEIKDMEKPRYKCPTPDRGEGDHYSFALMAARQKPGSFMIPIYITSDWSEIMDVPDEHLGVESNVADAVGSVCANGLKGMLEISNPEGQTVTVCDIAGRIVASSTSESISLSLASGIYIVRSPKGSAKVVVK